MLARAHSSSNSCPALTPQQQHKALTALHQQLSHHTGPTGGSSGSSGRSPVLAGAAALALGYCGLLGVPLPGMEAVAAAAENGNAAQTTANGSSGGSSNGSSESEPPLLQVLFRLCSSKDSRAVLRAVTALGYLGSGNSSSSSSSLKLAVAKGELLSVKMCEVQLLQCSTARGYDTVHIMCHWKSYNQ